MLSIEGVYAVYQKCMSSPEILCKGEEFLYQQAVSNQKFLSLSTELLVTPNVDARFRLQVGVFLSYLFSRLWPEKSEALDAEKQVPFLDFGKYLEVLVFWG